MKRMLLLAVVALGVSAPASAAPCTSAGPECTEWIGFAAPARSLVYRTHPLDRRNDQIRRALVMVHGAGRDADNYFRTALAAGFLAGALDDTVVISPRFASNGGGCQDALAANEVNWPCNGHSWPSGGAADTEGKLASDDFGGAILHKLATNEN